VANPTISSAVLTHNYITVTFSEACYNTDGASGALETTDFALTYTDNADAGSSNAAISSVTTTGNAALAGGETSIRIHITTTGIPQGLATVEVKAVADSIYNAAGEAMANTETTGVKTLNAFLHIYVSKAGNDSNNGLTAATSKLTLGSNTGVIATGENKIIVGVGEYTETTIWNAAGKLITLVGDYDASVFGGDPGEVIHKNSTNFTMNYLRAAERMVFKHSSSTGSAFFYFTTLAPTHAVTLDYCVLRAGSSYSHFSVSNSSYRTPLNSITLNNCSLDTGHLYMYGSVSRTYIEFNDWDSLTGGKSLYFKDTSSYVWGGIGDIVFNNSDLIYASLFGGIPTNMRFYSCTLKQAASGSILLDDTPYPGAGSYVSFRGTGYCTLKDCSLLTNGGSSINLAYSSYLNTVSSGDGSNINTNTGGYSHSVNQIYSMFKQQRVLLDNVNSNGIKILLVGGGTTLYGDTETYDDKDVLYHLGFVGTNSAAIPHHIIRLTGLAVSTEYDVKFHYKKVVDNTTSAYDARFGVLRGHQKARFDLRDTPANALGYINCLANEHSTDTWYDNKTVTFTTTADPDVEYYFVYYMAAYYQSFKITKPEISIHT